MGISEVLLVTLTLGAYLGASKLYTRYRKLYLNPLVVSVAVIVLLLTATGIPYTQYASANIIIDKLLPLTVVSLGYLLYSQVYLIKKEIKSIIAAILAGIVTGAVSLGAILTLLHTDHELLMSLLPKSVTTPIAVGIADQIGGNPSLTATIVICVGIFGSVIGPIILKTVGATHPVARGVAMGSAFHAVGTAKALEMGAVEGAMGALAIGITGVLSAVMLPLMIRLMSMF